MGIDAVNHSRRPPFSCRKTTLNIIRKLTEINVINNASRTESPNERGLLREREKRKLRGVVRHYRVGGGTIETEFGCLEGSQAVPASPSGKKP
jgi:hypothetical protein